MQSETTEALEKPEEGWDVPPTQGGDLIYQVIPWL